MEGAAPRLRLVVDKAPSLAAADGVVISRRLEAGSPAAADSRDEASAAMAPRPEKGNAAAEVIRQVAGERRARCGADARPCRRCPAPRLKRPVPRVTSATISGTITPSTAARDAVEHLHRDQQDRDRVTVANSRPRIGSAAKPRAATAAAPDLGLVADPRRNERRPRAAAPRCRPRSAPSPIGSNGGQHASHQRQHGRVGQMEEQPGSTPGSAAAALRQRSQNAPAARSACCRRARHGPAPDRSHAADIWRSASRVGTSSTAVTMNTAARGEKITARPHRGGRQSVADRGKAGVAAEPFADRGVADQSQADRGDGRAEHATGAAHGPRRRT